MALVRSGQRSKEQLFLHFWFHSVPSCFFATQSLRYKASTTQEYLKEAYRTGVRMTGGNLEPRSEPWRSIFLLSRCLLLKQSSSICDINDQIRGNTRNLFFRRRLKDVKRQRAGRKKKSEQASQRSGDHLRWWASDRGFVTERWDCQADGRFVHCT